METTLLVVAGGAVVLAILIGIANRKKKPTQHVQEPMVFVGAKPMGSPPLRVEKHQCNKRGWRAPPGHYFNDADELFSDVGDLIIDMMIIAELCGEQYSETIEEAAPAVESAASCCSEASASASCCSETPAKVTSQSETDTSSYSDGGGGCDSGDSGGGDCD